MEQNDYVKLKVNDKIKIINVSDTLKKKNYMIGATGQLILTECEQDRLDGIGLCILEKSELHLSDKEGMVYSIEYRDIYVDNDCKGTIKVKIDNCLYNMNKYGLV